VKAISSCDYKYLPEGSTVGQLNDASYFQFVSM